MLGAYFFAYTFVTVSGLPFWISAILAIIVMAIVGVFVSIAIFVPLGKIIRLYAMIATMMFSFVIVELVNILFTPIPFRLNSFLGGTTKVFGAIITNAHIWIIVAAAIVVVLLLLFMNKTKTGKAMRCVAENRETAEYMGINVVANMSITAAISTVICAVIGILIIPLYTVRTTMVGTIGLKGFAATIVGSFGSVPGAILGGILVGLLENFAVMAMPAVYKDVTAFVFVLMVLMIKPNGLLGGSMDRRLERIARKEKKGEDGNG